MFVLVGLPLLERALEEVFGTDAIHAQLQDVSGFTDVTLNSLVEQLHRELKRPKASSLFVQGIGHVIAIHLARNYVLKARKSHHCGSPPIRFNATTQRRKEFQPRMNTDGHGFHDSKALKALRKLAQRWPVGAAPGECYTK